MDEWRNALWLQFGAAIDTLEDALRVCPEQLWRARLWSTSVEVQLSLGFDEFWNICYHTLFWIDLYLVGSDDEFVPPDPFSTNELDPEGKLPERVYTKQELRTYLQDIRRRCQSSLTSMTVEQARRPCVFPWSRGLPISYFELQLYSMRHIQEHAAQLHLFLGQHDADSGSGWVARARGPVKNT